MDVKLEAEKYKLILANDLIVYLGSVLTYNMTKTQAAQFLGQTMETWSRRVDNQLSIARKDHIDAYKKEIPDEADDVINILIGIHTIIPSILREEFMEETFELLQKTVVASKDG